MRDNRLPTGAVYPTNRLLQRHPLYRHICGSTAHKILPKRLGHGADISFPYQELCEMRAAENRAMGDPACTVVSIVNTALVELRCDGARAFLASGDQQCQTVSKNWVVNADIQSDDMNCHL